MVQKSLAEKVKLLNKAKEEKSKNASLTIRQLAALVGISKSTLLDWQKNESKLRAQHEMALLRGRGLKRKRFRMGKEENVESAVNEWFDAMRLKGQALTGTLIRAKAEEFASKLGIEGYSASTGWLSRWKQRRGVDWKKSHGEAASADPPDAGEWGQTEMRRVLKEYTPNRVYNADETGLFYRAVPDGSLCYAKEKLQGFNKAMARLTILVCANMDGTDKKKLLVLGKSQHPRCFKGLDVTKLPVTYRANSKTWMTSSLFEDWLKEWDRQLEGKSNICLLVDNCPAHPNLPTFVPKNIELVFWSPNTTSALQPMDQGIIKSLKTHYRAELVKFMLSLIDDGNLSSSSSAIDVSRKISVLDAIQFVAKSWRSVTPQTVANCWRRAGFVNDNAPDHNEATSLSNDDSCVEAVLAAVKGRAHFEACDDDFIPVEEHNDLELTEAIVARLRHTDESNEAEENWDGFDEPPPPLIKHKEAKNAITILQRYMLQQGMKEGTWEHIDILASAVEANAASLALAVVVSEESVGFEMLYNQPEVYENDAYKIMNCHKILKGAVQCKFALWPERPPSSLLKTGRDSITRFLTSGHGLATSTNPESDDVTCDTQPILKKEKTILPSCVKPTKSKLKKSKSGESPNKPECKEDLKKLLDNACLQTYNKFRLSDEGTRERVLFTEKMQTHLRENCHPKMKLELFGSSVNGFGTNASDVDACLTFEGNKNGENVSRSVLAGVCDSLRDFELCTNVQSINATIPIVTFDSHGQNFRNGDISLYNRIAIRNTALLRTYADLDERSSILGLMLKRTVKSLVKGRSSYSLIIMLIHFLQQCEPPVLPVLQQLGTPTQRPSRIVDGWETCFYDDIEKISRVWSGLGANTDSVGELWFKLLQYYSEFDFENHVITVRHQKKLHKNRKVHQLNSVAREYNPARARRLVWKDWVKRTILVEDPFDQVHNLTAIYSQSVSYNLIDGIKVEYGKLLKANNL